MECPKCKAKINDTAAIDYSFTRDGEIDLSVKCPECEAEYFTFISMGDLTPND